MVRRVSGAVFPIAAFLTLTLSVALIGGCRDGGDSANESTKTQPVDYGHLEDEYYDDLAQQEAVYEARAEGFDEGQREGYSSGYDDGYQEGYDEGFLEGFDEGCIALGNRLIELGVLDWYECPSY